MFKWKKRRGKERKVVNEKCNQNTKCKKGEMNSHIMYECLFVWISEGDFVFNMLPLEWKLTTIIFHQMNIYMYVFYKEEKVSGSTIACRETMNENALDSKIKLIWSVNDFEMLLQTDVNHKDFDHMNTFTHTHALILTITW